MLTLSSALSHRAYRPYKQGTRAKDIYMNLKTESCFSCSSALTGVIAKLEFDALDTDAQSQCAIANIILRLKSHRDLMVFGYTLLDLCSLNVSKSV